MATITAAAGGGDWNTGASWVGGVAPTAADDALVTSASGNMSVGTGAVCRSANFNTFAGTLSGTGTLTIGDGTAGLSNIALKLVSGMTVSGAPAFTFVSTSATVQTVDFAGKSVAHIIFNATSNGSWQLTGALSQVFAASMATNLNLTKGSLDFNGQAVNINGLVSNNNNVRSLTFGTGCTVSLASNGSIWNITDGTNLTVVSSNEVITSPNNNACTFIGGGKTYYSLVRNSPNSTVAFTVSGANTFTNLTISSNANKSGSFVLASDQVATGTLTLTGQSSVNRILVQSNTVGTSRTITAAAISISNTDFQDITGAGAASWDLSARTDIGDCGGNSGITFPAGVNQTWSGTSGGNWSTNGWTTRVPLPQDDVYLGAAFTASQTVTADMPRLGRSIYWTGTTGSPTWAFSSHSAFYGNIVLSGISITGNYQLSFCGRGSYNVTTNGITATIEYIFNAPGGTYGLAGSITCKGVYFYGGTINTNNYTITLNQQYSVISVGQAGVTKVVNLGTSSILFTGANLASSFWSSSNTSGLTLNASDSTISIVNGGTGTKTFSTGTAQTFGTLDYTSSGSTGGLDLVTSNSFAAINFSDPTNARTLRFAAGTTTTIRNANGFNVQGTSGKLMTVTSTTGATHTITSPYQQSCDYLNLSYSTATGAGAWYAGANSTNGGGNSGWLFEAAPVIEGSNTDFTPQQVLNILYGSPSTTLYTEQEIANLYHGTSKTDLTMQQVLNIRQGGRGTDKTEAQVIFENIATATGLTGSSNSYSVQELLNIAYKNNLALLDIFL